MAQLRQFLDSTQALEFARLADNTACDAHIAQTIQRFSYAELLPQVLRQVGRVIGLVLLQEFQPVADRAAKLA